MVEALSFFLVIEAVTRRSNWRGPRGPQTFRSPLMATPVECVARLFLSGCNSFGSFSIAARAPRLLRRMARKAKPTRPPRSSGAAVLMRLHALQCEVRGGLVPANSPQGAT